MAPSSYDAIGAGFDLAGIAGGIFGSSMTAAGAKKKAEAEMAIARLEMQADQQRRQAMEISARRQQLQTVRTAQQAQAMGLAASVSQGGQFSTGAQAGQQGVKSQETYANQGVSLNLQTGEKLFDINSDIGHQKLNYAEAEKQMAEGQGLSSLFGSLGKAGGDIMKIASFAAVL